MIDKIFIISFIVIGIWCMYLDGMILGFIGNWVETNLPKWMVEPICGCVVCMAAWYGTALYWVIWGESVKEWVIVVFSSMGVNTIFAKFKKH